ncbi:MAG: hypothetical protein JWO56_1815 [Acidobacteria bacterium]|nr:hypothetical protein [Acidobacteriota bacterium]
MSSVAHVSVATRVVVAIVACVLLFMWVIVPAGCGPRHELHYKLVALGALLIASIPLVLRAVRGTAGAVPAGRARWDIAGVAAMTALLLFMQWGPGRRVIPDGCGFAPDTGMTP